MQPILLLPSLTSYVLAVKAVYKLAGEGDMHRDEYNTTELIALTLTLALTLT